MARPKTIKLLKFLGQIPTWTVTEEDEDSYRWAFDLKIADTLVCVNVIVPSSESPRPHLNRLESLIRKLDCRFKENLDTLTRWYANNLRNSSIPQFRSQIMKDITLFVDYTKTPTERRLVFHNASDFQELDPIVMLNGSIRV